MRVCGHNKAYHKKPIFLDFTSPFTPVTAAENPVIELSNLRLLQFSGKAHLGNKAMRFLECDITAEFRSKGMGDVKMVG